MGDLGNLEIQVGKESIIPVCWGCCPETTGSLSLAGEVYRLGSEARKWMGQGSICTWRAPVISPPCPDLSRFQWGQRGGTIYLSVGSAHTESWVGTQSQSSSISTARCSLLTIAQSSSVSAASESLAAGAGGRGVKGNGVKGGPVGDGGQRRCVAHRHVLW